MTDKELINHLQEKNAEYIETIQALKADKWISVKNRLPEKGGKYLVIWQGKSIDTCMFLNNKFSLYGESKTHFVTHWMQLPEPQKGGLIHNG